MSQKQLTSHIQRLSRRNQGFTIVELLVVVIIIGILAAIAIIAYNAVTKNAIETSLKSDLSGSSSGLETYKKTNGNYPSSLGFSASGGNILDYQSLGNSYCITATNPKTNQIYSYRSSDGVTKDGPCSVEITSFATGNEYDLTAHPSADFVKESTNVAGIEGMATDGKGNLYVTRSNYGSGSSYMQYLRKIDKSGTQTTIYTSPTYSGSSGSLKSVIATPDGTLYVRQVVGSAGGTLHQIIKVSPAGVASVLAGSTTGYVDGVGTAAKFNFGSGTMVMGKDGNLYLADDDNWRIRKITPDGTVSTFAGSGAYTNGDGTGTAASFRNPTLIIKDIDGNLYVASSRAGVSPVRKITVPGAVVTTLGSVPYNAEGLAIDRNGNVFTAGQVVSGTIQSVDVYKVVGGTSTLFKKFGERTYTGQNLITSWSGNALEIDENGNMYVSADGIKSLAF